MLLFLFFRGAAALLLRWQSPLDFWFNNSNAKVVSLLNTVAHSFSFCSSHGLKIALPSLFLCFSVYISTQRGEGSTSGLATQPCGGVGRGGEGRGGEKERRRERRGKEERGEERVQGSPSVSVCLFYPFSSWAVLPAILVLSREVPHDRLTTRASIPPKAATAHMRN